MTHEQNTRQALVDSMPRDLLLEVIAKHLFAASHRRGVNFHNFAPHDWYRTSYVRLLK